METDLFERLTYIAREELKMVFAKIHVRALILPTYGTTPYNSLRILWNDCNRMVSPYLYIKGHPLLSTRYNILHETDLLSSNSYSFEIQRVSSLCVGLSLPHST